MTRIEINGGLDHLEYRPGSGSTVEVFDICVRSVRRKGIGRAMVESLMARLPAGTVVWALTRPENRIACQFYEGIGWTRAAELPGFYNGDDAVLYRGVVAKGGDE